MFDLRVSPSLERLPGRFVNLCWDSPVMAKKTYAERLQQMREYAAKHKALTQNANSQVSAAPKKARLSQSELAMDDATYWATNRERINARRRKVGA